MFLHACPSKKREAGSKQQPNHQLKPFFPISLFGCFGVLFEIWVFFLPAKEDDHNLLLQNSLNFSKTKRSFFDQEVTKSCVMIYGPDDGMVFFHI